MAVPAAFHLQSRGAVSLHPRAVGRLRSTRIVQGLDEPRAGGAAAVSEGRHYATRRETLG